MSITEPSFYVTGGTLRQDARSYVERQADTDLYDGLQQGEFCYVLTSRQMGKSSLMVHTAIQLRQEGVAVVVVDLTAIGQNLSAEQWYGGLLRRLGRQLDPSGDLDETLEEFWFEREARVGPLERWMEALEQVVLPKIAARIVLFIDEIDAVRSLPFSTDEFFAAIRECYNRRSQAPEFQRLTFCLLGVATPSDLIQDTRTTPFNIGKRIELTDFAAAEAAPLAQGLGRDPKTSQVLLQRVLHWTGGHPYLTQRLCRAVAEDETATDPAGVDRLCEALFLSPSAQERDDNLLFVRERLLKSEADRASLLDLYGQVRTGRRVRLDDTNQLVSLLRLSGITRVAEGALRVRNRIYARVFDRAWVARHLPDAEVRRQKAAYRRGLWRATAVAAVVLAMMARLALVAVNEARRAILPNGWVVHGSNAPDYEAGVDQTLGPSGEASASIRSRAPQPQGFGTLMQTFQAGAYQGKRLRLSGLVKASEIANWAGLWMRVDGRRRTALSFDNMEHRPIKGSTDWKPYSIVLDVPRDSDDIAFGILLHGKGQAWVSDLKFEVVSKDVPTTGEKLNTPQDTLPKQPVNLDFAQ